MAVSIILFIEGNHYFSLNSCLVLVLPKCQRLCPIASFLSPICCSLKISPSVIDNSCFTWRYGSRAAFLDCLYFVWWRFQFLLDEDMSKELNLFFPELTFFFVKKLMLLHDILLAERQSSVPLCVLLHLFLQGVFHLFSSGSGVCLWRLWTLLHLKHLVKI